MSENLARCRRCHDVFDPDLGACPRCGTPYVPIAAPPDPALGTYADRYAGSQFSAPVANASEVVPHANERTVMTILVAGGGLLTVAVIAVLAMLLGAGRSSATPPTIVSIAPATSAPPSPTTPPQIAMALQAINDPNLNAHIFIKGRVDVDSVIAGHPWSDVITMDCQIAGGDEQLTLTRGATVEELRYVDSIFYLRVMPAGKWMTKSAMNNWAMIVPLFNLQTERMLEYVGDEQREGVATYHFRTTNRWAADIGRLGFLDAATLPIKPDRVQFDLWTDTFGKPVYASFNAQNLATDGRKLVEIQTTWTFSDVGTPVTIVNPMATPTPVPSPSPSPAT